ncbi:alpha-1,3-arabinosyltransferase XAT3-like [Zingiber officinale]|uniref:Glycosyltransferase 61 catalytic domain-containing protein n=1 Tax=Zingiber officinale TaxID=94328 RepID=A0A8J5KKI6_ZINOF|nr:alpha-1,3-arabinosyltransferase XAT3-like [Zingiber officinale]KAG6480358.1 hypothetical protein ZIOFF_063858 [Zingiber officinale]
MKSHRSAQKAAVHRKTGNALFFLAMLMALCVLSLLKARCFSAPLGRSLPAADAQEHAEMERSKGSATAAAESEAEAAGNRAICFETSKRSDVCEAQGDIRIHGSGHTIFLDPSITDREWKTRPYCRKHDPLAMENVKEWAMRPFPGGDVPPLCTANYSVPALVFSIGGFTGNLFHDFTDVIVPLFVSSYRFNGEVRFVIADAKPWWVSKFALILRRLSKYDVIDARSEEAEAVRCFPRVVVGLSFHKELGVDSSRTPTGYSAADFKAMLREAYGLERKTAAPAGDEWDIRRKPPRLLIISRRKTRAFLNERGMADMAASLGFDVRTAEPESVTDLAKLARLVNSADVMLGVHGAGLTNLVFLPAGAVLIQVVPMGGLEWLARDTFGRPAPEMEIEYMQYVIQEDESTLTEQYPKEHPVLKDPLAIQRQGWSAMSKIYLDNQNVRPHLGRLRNTLIEAIKHLPHARHQS